MGKISVVINVVEEELGVLPKALKSVQKLASEIVVVDMSKSGVSVSTVIKYGLKVHKHKLVTWVEPARNFALQKAKGDWILVLDPDEEVSKGLAKKLKSIVKEDKYDYVTVPRANMVFSKWLEHSRWWPDYNVRFFKKGKVRWNKEIQSPPITSGKGMDIEAKRSLALVHHHYTSIDQYLTRMKRYTVVQAEERVKEGYQFDWKDLIKKPVGEFLSRYFFGKSYKDGVHGLAVSSLQALSELVVYLRVWEGQKKFAQIPTNVREVVGEMKKMDREVFYWRGDALGGIVGRIKRKFKLR